MAYDVIVIGSGFGGAVAAKRFTEAGKTVCILEMGERWKKSETDTGPGSMPEQSQDTKFILRCFGDYPADYMESHPKCLAVAGIGYGGGSLVYSKIHLRAPESAFEPGVNVNWPSGYTRANLDPYYARVEEPRPNNAVGSAYRGVGLIQDPKTFNYKRSAVFSQGTCSVLGMEAQANLLAQTKETGTEQNPNYDGCKHCGWCVPMCKFGRKNTMAHTYLADAAATGKLTVFTNRRVKLVTKAGSGAGYDVMYWKTDGVTHNYHTVNSGTVYYQRGTRVVIAAGALESPCILQRSLTEGTYGRARINSFSGSSDLGQRIDGQADFAVGGFVPQTTETYKGSIMAAHVSGSDYFIEDLHGIPGGPTVKFESSFYMNDSYRGWGDHSWGLAFKQKFRDWATNMFAMVIVGKSPSGGNMSVTNNNGVTQLSNQAYLPHALSYQQAKDIVTGLGGQLGKTPWEREGQAVTAHSTGGCHMGTVVDARNLEVYNNANLNVMDSSVIPHTYANPVHTILAVAQKGCDVILNENSPPSW